MLEMKSDMNRQCTVLQLHTAYFSGGAFVTDSCDFRKGAETGKLSITLLYKYSCHSDRRGIRDCYALQAELVNQLIVDTKLMSSSVREHSHGVR